MLITSTVEICIQHLGRVEEMVFAARRSYASAVLGVVILSVCYTRALWLIQRTYRRYFYTTWKGNPSSQMWFCVQLCSSWQDFNWLKGSRGLSAAAELLVKCVTTSATFITNDGQRPVVNGNGDWPLANNGQVVFTKACVLHNIKSRQNILQLNMISFMLSNYTNIRKSDAADKLTLQKYAY